MAATVLSRRSLSKALSAALLLVFSGPPLLADRAGDIREQLSYVATSLSASNATDAMGPFDKSYVNYDKLASYFRGLTAFQLESEVDVTDEEDSAEGAKLTVAWTLTLTDLTTGRTDHRSADINVRLALKNGKWKIVEFSPIDIFNPLRK